MVWSDMESQELFLLCGGEILSIESAHPNQIDQKLCIVVELHQIVFATNGATLPCL